MEGVPLRDFTTHALNKLLSLYRLDINDSALIPDVLSSEAGKHGVSRSHGVLSSPHRRPFRIKMF